VQKVKNSKDPITNSLLVAGAESYSEALAAISEFCREVQTLWLSALVSDLAEMSAAMGVALDRAEIKNYAWPDSFVKNIDGAWAALGAKIDREKKEGWKQLFYLEWEDGRNYVTMLIAFRDPDVAGRVFDHLQKFQKTSKPVIMSHKNGVFIQQEILANRMQDFGKLTRGIDREWIGLWKRAGGLRKAMQ
jgi:hypothetical protein